MIRRQISLRQYAVDMQVLIGNLRMSFFVHLEALRVS